MFGCYLVSGAHVSKSYFTFLNLTFTNDHTERNSIFFAELKLVQHLWVLFVK